MLSISGSQTYLLSIQLKFPA